MTVNVALFTGSEASETVINDVPALTEVITIFPSPIAAVATPSVAETTVAPTKPNVASLLEVLSSVAAVKTTGGVGAPPPPPP